MKLQQGQFAPITGASRRFGVEIARMLTTKDQRAGEPSVLGWAIAAVFHRTSQARAGVEDAT